MGVLLFPDVAVCSKETRDGLRAKIAAALAAHNREQGGASSRTVTSALLLTEPPSIDAGEITDKGYINQRAVLTVRAPLVEALFSADAPDVIRLD